MKKPSYKLGFSWVYKNKLLTQFIPQEILIHRLDKRFIIELVNLLHFYVNLRKLV